MSRTAATSRRGCGVPDARQPALHTCGGQIAHRGHGPLGLWGSGRQTARVSLFLRLDTTPAVGKSRIAAPGRSGRVEATDRSPALYSVCGYYTTPKNKMK